MFGGNQVVETIAFIALLIPSVIVHEVTHGVVADRFGDPTARKAGRLTANPIPHIDPFGSIILPALLALSRANVFGWARPVPVNPRFFRRPREQMAIVALAGPLSNLTLAVLLAKLGPFAQVGDRIAITQSGLLADLLWTALILNTALAVFNLLPIPPLDGSRLVPLALPERLQEPWAKIEQFGFLIIFLLLFVIPGSLSFLGTVLRWLLLLIV